MNPRQVSPAGVAFIRREEGCQLHVYHDAAGVPTIGVGHVLLPGEHFPSGITQEQADEFLRHDLTRFESSVCMLVEPELTQPQFDAMVSFAFNVGTGALAMSTLLRCINDGLAADCKIHFLEWDKRRDPETGKLVVDPVLHARRAREWALFSSPPADAVDADAVLALVDRTATEMLRAG